jgi:hypothetical protein
MWWYPAIAASLRPAALTIGSDVLLGLSDEMCETVVILTCLAALLDNFAMRLTMLNFALQPTL